MREKKRGFTMQKTERKLEEAQASLKALLDRASSLKAEIEEEKASFEVWRAAQVEKVEKEKREIGQLKEELRKKLLKEEKKEAEFAEKETFFLEREKKINKEEESLRRKEEELRNGWNSLEGREKRIVDQETVIEAEKKELRIREGVIEQAERLSILEKRGVKLGPSK